MVAKYPYLTQSPTGRFSYRRKVPELLRPYFPPTATGGVMREWKSSLHTNNRQIASRRWMEENQKFDAAEKLANTIAQGQQRNLPAYDAVQRAKHIAQDAGFHPDQAPQLPLNATDDDIEKFKVERKDWFAWLDLHRQLIAETDSDERTDHKQLEKDYKSGRWGEPEYAIPLKPTNPNSVLTLAKRILEGELRPSLVPTWIDATEAYISVNKQIKTRDSIIEQKWEIKTRGLLERFGSENGGQSIALGELDRNKIRMWLQKTYTNQSTRNRYVNTMSAVINNWNREYAKQPVQNSFAGLANKTRENEQAKKRLSFKPEQLKVYLDAILSHPDQEVRLIGLLMAWTGCRTSEASGLSSRDVKLQDEVPHVIYRSNSIRRMEKGGLERAVPLAKPLVDAMTGYNLTNTEGPFFPRHGTTKGAANVSAALRYILKNKAMIEEKSLVPYSLRHTMKDRLTQTDLDSAKIEYLLGHRSSGSSAIHARYGTLPPPKNFLDAMNRLPEITTWGYFEE